jgi:hypothetical protein
MCINIIRRPKRAHTCFVGRGRGKGRERERERKRDSGGG